MVDEAREEADRNSTQSFFKTRERGYDIYMYVVLGVLILLVLFLKFLY